MNTDAAWHACAEPEQGVDVCEHGPILGEWWIGPASVLRVLVWGAIVHACAALLSG